MAGSKCNNLKIFSNIPQESESIGTQGDISSRIFPLPQRYIKFHIVFLFIDGILLTMKYSLINIQQNSFLVLMFRGLRENPPLFNIIIRNSTKLSKIPKSLKRKLKMLLNPLIVLQIIDIANIVGVLVPERVYMAGDVQRLAVLEER